MRTILRRMQENFLGWHLPLRVRLFNMMGFAGIGIALIASIVSVLNGEPLVSTLANLVTALIAFALIYYAPAAAAISLLYYHIIVLIYMFPPFLLAGLPGSMLIFHLAAVSPFSLESENFLSSASFLYTLPLHLCLYSPRIFMYLGSHPYGLLWVNICI